MTTIFKLFPIPLLLCIALTSRAQTDTLEVSLKQAMAYATEFGYQSINAQTDIEIARKKVRETLAIGLPQVNASADFSKYLKVPKVILDATTFDPNAQEGDIFEAEFAQPYGLASDLNVTQLLFDGSYFVGLQASKVYVRLSDNVKEKTDIELKQAVAEAYFIALVAQQNISEFKKSLEVNKKTLKQTKAYFENGFKEDIDVDQMRLMVNESERLYTDALNQEQIAIAILKFAMGYAIEKPLKLTDKINGLLDFISITPMDSRDIKSHIDYRSLITQIDIKNLDIKNQRAVAMPKLNAFFNYNYSMSGQELSSLYDFDATLVGLSLSVPIFSSGQRSAQMKQKKLELKKLDSDRSMLEQSLKRDLLVAETNLENARQQFNNAKLSKEISKRIYDKSLIKFENGMMNSLQLSQNENNMVEAIILFSQASSNYFNRYIQYQKATSQL
ncbi:MULTISPECIES: TolC family protein [unclassified Saccharicrinis]|uniref:TolC family protein n=1 Tax=unclassified Saccharicrinis TaxID=2646859 RepID=UPI003D34ECDB